MEVNAPESGTIESLIVEEGATCEVGKPLVSIRLGPGGAAPTAPVREPAQVDGVLHTVDAANTFSGPCLQRLALLLEMTGASIVLSSSWRVSSEGRERVNEELELCVPM